MYIAPLISISRTSPCTGRTICLRIVSTLTIAVLLPSTTESLRWSRSSSVENLDLLQQIWWVASLSMATNSSLSLLINYSHIFAYQLFVYLCLPIIRIPAILQMRPDRIRWPRYADTAPCLLRVNEFFRRVELLAYHCFAPPSTVSSWALLYCYMCTGGILGRHWTLQLRLHFLPSQPFALMLDVLS